MNHILDFIHQTSFADLPAQVQRQAQVCVLDLVGSLAGGQQTKLSAIIRQHACQAFGGDQASLLLDGRRCSAPGAALANGMTIDSMDIHDSYRQSLRLSYLRGVGRGLVGGPVQPVARPFG